MILQRSHLIVNCPVCGRPAEIKSQHLGLDFTCGHCRGNFLLVTADDGSPTAVKQFGADSLRRAEQLLRGVSGADAPAPGWRFQRLTAH